LAQRSVSGCVRVRLVEVGGVLGKMKHVGSPEPSSWASGECGEPGELDRDGTELGGVVGSDANGGGETTGSETSRRRKGMRRVGKR
jgi:hypothetical protein